MFSYKQQLKGFPLLLSSPLSSQRGCFVVMMLRDLLGGVSARPLIQSLLKHRHRWERGFPLPF